jgi:hypothetical protein
MLNCLMHKCAASCHNLADHSKVACQEAVSDICPRGHFLTRRCHESCIPSACKACQRDDKLARQKQQAKLEEKQLKEAAEREHLQEMAELDAEIEKEHHQKRKAAKEAEERARAVLLWRRRADLAALTVKARTTIRASSMSTHQPGNASEPPQAHPLSRTYPEPSLACACKNCERENRRKQQAEEQDQQEREELIALNTLRLQALGISETGGAKFTS